MMIMMTITSIEKNVITTKEIKKHLVIEVLF
jgi:hypothetical protein